MKKKSLPKLRETLWRWFSEFIRLRDSNDDGIGQCISCGKFVRIGIGKADAGHYYPKGNTYAALSYDEKNVNVQCSHCNRFLEGNKQGYEKGLIKKYGSDVIQYLDIKKGNKTKYYGFMYEALIIEYKQKVKKLRKQK